MATINDKLTYLAGTKDAIKQAIINKGVSVSDTDTFRSYANKIEAIQTGGGGTTNIPDGTKFSYSTFTTVPDSFIPYLETQTDMSNMFSYCKLLTSVPLLDTSQCTDMVATFRECNLLTSVPLLDTSQCTNMNSMFQSCYQLRSLPGFSTKNVTNMGYMLTNCRSLTSVAQFDVSNVNNVYRMFYNCDSLTNLGGFTGLKLDLDLSYSPSLTVDSVMNVINNAADMTSEPKTLKLHKTVFNKLSQEQIATASAKGWNVAAR